jgi:hypothetical protein
MKAMNLIIIFIIVIWAPRVAPNQEKTLDPKLGARNLKLSSTTWTAEPRTIDFCREKWAYYSLKRTQIGIVVVY